MTNHKDLNRYIGEGDAYKRGRPFHATLLAQTEEGLKNLFKLVSIHILIIFIEYLESHVLIH